MLSSGFTILFSNRAHLLHLTIVYNTQFYLFCMKKVRNIRGGGALNETISVISRVESFFFISLNCNIQYTTETANLLNQSQNRLLLLVIYCTTMLYYRKNHNNADRDWGGLQDDVTQNTSKYLICTYFVFLNYYYFDNESLYRMLWISLNTRLCCVIVKCNMSHPYTPLLLYWCE